MRKLIEALHVIKDECNRHESCASCPMEYEGVCCVTDLEPADWKINDDAQKALL